MKRDRAWLRGFLNLGALQQVERISDEAIRLQEDTVLAALDILDREPGVLLADEVGMGKTFQALGLLAATCELTRDGSETPRVLVVTPGPDLNRQWLRSAEGFEHNGFYRGFPKNSFQQALHITQLPEASRRHPVVFVPVNVFTSVRGHAERGFLLDLWFRHRELHGNTCNAIRQRLIEAELPFEEGDTFLGRQADDFVDLPSAAFKGQKGGHAGLDDLYDTGGIEAFRNTWAVKKALDRVRFQLVRKVLPEFDLLIVDEAHKLKNPWTVQAQAVTQVLGGRFRRAVFLTATPFQLGVHELRRVFEMFGHASQVRDGFTEDVEALFASIEDYQRTYDAFEEAWRFADSGHAADFSHWYAQVGGALAAAEVAPALDEIDDPNVATLARYVWELRRLKSQGVEPGFRRWTLRSLKPGKRERRRDRATPIVPPEVSVAPLLLYQRLMIARAVDGERSHVEAAETNIASSFAAAREGAMLLGASTSPETRAYQAVLAEVLQATQDAHPKMQSVLHEAMGAADRWEKSLLFCERIATIDSLHKAIEDRWMQRLLAHWQRLYPGSEYHDVFGAGSGDERSVGTFQRWAVRFTRGQDQLSIALREAYPHTLLVPPDEPGLPAAMWSAIPELLDHANDVVRGQRSSSGNAARLDYRIARRCVDVAVARWFERHRPIVLDAYGGIPGNLLDDAYPRTGLALELDEAEHEEGGSDGDVPISWTISEDVLRTVLHPDRRSPWFQFRSELGRWDAAERRAIVEAIRTFLTRRQVPFVVEVLDEAGGAKASSNDVRDAIERLWQRDDWPWRQRVAEFLDYLPRLGASERADVLGEALKRGEFAARGNQPERRQAIQDAFNTPFFPMVLVGNRTMQEGLNLHRQCRRVVHHDLRWNPADVEQRVGRVDRHGSLAERRLAQTSERDGHILIDTPILERTIDPTRYRRVKEREKWLEFLLGAPPAIGEDGLEHREVQPLPVALTEDLRIRLEPPKAGWQSGSEQA